MTAARHTPFWLQLIALQTLATLLQEASDPATDLDSRVEIAGLLSKVHPAGLPLADALTTTTTTTKGNERA